MTLPTEFTTERDPKKKKAILKKAIEDALKTEKLVANTSVDITTLDKLVENLFTQQASGGNP